MGQSARTGSAPRAMTEVDRAVGQSLRQTLAEASGAMEVSHKQFQKYESINGLDEVSDLAAVLKGGVRALRRHISRKYLTSALPRLLKGQGAIAFNK